MLLELDLCPRTRNQTVFDAMFFSCLLPIFRFVHGPTVQDFRLAGINPGPIWIRQIVGGGFFQTLRSFFQKLNRSWIVLDLLFRPEPQSGEDVFHLFLCRPLFTLRNINPQVVARVPCKVRRKPNISHAASAGATIAFAFVGTEQFVIGNELRKVH